MRTRVIPAQITTVEDKIAGNFSLTQIIILLAPVLFATLVFVLFPPSMMFVWYKLSLTLLFSFLCIVLAIRVKGKIIVSWIIVLTRFNLRPKYYVFNKNDTFSRIIPEEYIKEEKVATTIVEEKAELVATHSIKELLQLNQLIQNKDFNLRFSSNKKGGLHVAFEKVSK